MQIFSGTGFLTITDSPPNNDSPPTTSTLTSPPTSNQPTATTTSNQPTNNPFVQHVDVHSSPGRGSIDPYIAGLPVYDERPENDLVFGVLTSVGYFFITIVLMIGVIMGDDQRYTVRKFSLEMMWPIFPDVPVQLLWVPLLHCDGVWADWCIQACTICKFVLLHEFWFCICLTFQGVAKARAMGSMAILTSFVFLVDTVFNVMAMWNGQ